MISNNIPNAHQIGPKYSSNNAGDGPEKTSNGKYWIPIRRSIYLNEIRPQQVFHSCECARYTKNTNTSHLECVCGRDEYHLALEMEKYWNRLDMKEILCDWKQGERRKLRKYPSNILNDNFKRRHDENDFDSNEYFISNIPRKKQMFLQNYITNPKPVHLRFDEKTLSTFY